MHFTGDVVAKWINQNKMYIHSRFPFLVIKGAFEYNYIRRIIIISPTAIIMCFCWSQILIPVDADALIASSSPSSQPVEQDQWICSLAAAAAAAAGTNNKHEELSCGMKLSRKIIAPADGRGRRRPNDLSGGKAREFHSPPMEWC